MFKPTIENLAFMMGLIASGISANEIADYLECHRQTVYRWKAKFLENPHFFFNGCPSVQWRSKEIN